MDDKEDLWLVTTEAVVNMDVVAFIDVVIFTIIGVSVSGMFNVEKSRYNKQQQS